MKIIGIGQARRNSSRCKNKMLRQFGETSLVEIAVKRLANLSALDNAYFGAYDDEILDIAKKHLESEKIIKRTKEMANTNDMILSYSWIKDIDFDYCIWINSCHGHLRAETIDYAVNKFKKSNYKSMTSVIKKYNWFYNQNGDPINNFDPKTQVTSQQAEFLYQTTNAFHIFNKEHFFTEKTYWNNKRNDPGMFVINEIEALDVDTEEDFIIAESVYKNLIVD